MEKGIYMKINYFNPEHAHTLIDLPTNKNIEEVVQLFKGASSHWINEQKLLRGRFTWGRRYGGFSVSHSDVGRVAAYIARQQEHHQRKSFSEEFQLFVKKYGLEWREE
jgi:putative transposase